MTKISKLRHEEALLVELLAISYPSLTALTAINHKHESRPRQNLKATLKTIESIEVVLEFISRQPYLSENPSHRLSKRPKKQQNSYIIRSSAN